MTGSRDSLPVVEARTQLPREQDASRPNLQPGVPAGSQEALLCTETLPAASQAEAHARSPPTGPGAAGPAVAPGSGAGTGTGASHSGEREKMHSVLTVLNSASHFNRQTEPTSDTWREASSQCEFLPPPPEAALAGGLRRPGFLHAPKRGALIPVRAHAGILVSTPHQGCVRSPCIDVSLSL